MWTELIAFVLVMAAGQFSPGPDMILLTQTSLSNGVKAGISMAGGIASGLAIHGSLAAFGLAFLLEQNPWLDIVLLATATLYLLRLTKKLLQGASLEQKRDLAWNPKEEDANSVGKFWRKGFVCNILNPKVAIFLTSVMLPFLGGDRASHLNSNAYWPWILLAIVVFEGLLLWSIWVCVLQVAFVKNWYWRWWRWLDRCFAFTLVYLITFAWIRAMT
jgi:threonine efflux protein